MDVPFSQRYISQRNTRNSNNVLLMGEEFFGEVCTVAGIVVGHLPLPLMSFSPLPLDVPFFPCNNLPLVRWFRSLICFLSRLVIGLANLVQFVKKFGLILGVMNRPGLRCVSEKEWTSEMLSLV